MNNTHTTITPSYEDLRCAGLIIACQQRICQRTGAAMYNADFIAWAKEIFSLFSRAAWTWVRSGIGSLGKAWAWLKAAGKAVTAILAQPVKPAIQAPEGATGKRLVKSVHTGTGLVAIDTVFAPVMCIRSDQRLANFVNRYRNY